MVVIWIKFIICTILILFAGKRVAKYGDAIAEKTGLGGLWIGVVLVAVATSLPEMFTGIGSIVFVDAPDLTIGNLFGANTYNLLNIALLDLLHKGPPLLAIVSGGQLLTAGLSLIPVLVAVLGMSLRTPEFGFFHISIYSILILVLYLVSTKIIFRFEMNRQKISKGLKKEEEIVFKYSRITLKKAWLFYGISAGIIIGAGIWLAYIGDELSRLLELDQNFVGSLFIGFTTTLPEITVSVAALRLGAKELAVANMFGSNLFNMAIIFIDDLLYKKAPIFNVISSAHIFTGLIVIIMSIIVIGGLCLKPKNKTRLGLSAYAVALIIVFILGAYINFRL
jgi:cation:H+ antiporter